MPSYSAEKNSDLTRAYFQGKRVLVTGACGTVGKQLVKQLLGQFDLAMLTAIDHNESELVFLEAEHGRRENARFLLCDVRDCGALVRESRRVDIIFHAAAYKHVYACERSPLEAVQTNIIGVQNVIQAALENEVERLVFTSSDKAVNPTNVMGTSKLMGERLVTAAAIHPDHSGLAFISTRFGNVLGSRGSVIPIFRDQIRRGGPLTLSDPQMTRFIMSLDDAVGLVVKSAVLGSPGDVLITKMPAIRILDLAKVMISELGPRFGYRADAIKIQIVGPKPGEKLYEELMNEEETRRAFELDEYFVIRPAMASIGIRAGVDLGSRVERPYNSETVPSLSEAELTEFMYRNRLLEE